MMPGILTVRGCSVRASAMRSTWAITSPPEFLAAIAMARLSSVSASRSMREVARGVGGGGADEGDVDRERLVEQPLLAVELDQPDQLLGGGAVDLAAVLARVDEGAQAHLGEGAGLAGGDVAVEVRDHALRQVVGLDPVLDREPADLRDQPPMPADHALEQPVMAEPVEPLLLAVALPGREQQGQVARLAGRDEAPLQPDQQIVRRADADEARGAERVAAADQRHRLGEADDLVALLALAEAALVGGAGRHRSLPLLGCRQVWQARPCASMPGRGRVRSCQSVEFVRAKIDVRRRPLGFRRALGAKSVADDMASPRLSAHTGHTLA